eukprot:3821787-Amphidinium_carterae.1
MLGLMEPEQLAPYGYEVTDSKGVRDKLDTSSNTTVGLISMSERKVGVMTTDVHVGIGSSSSEESLRTAAGSVMRTTTTSVVPPLPTQLLQ